MTRIPTCTVLALAVASISTAAFGQVFHENTTGAAGTYGTPYGYLGLNGQNTWEQYRKFADLGYGGFGAVTGANVADNKTAVDYSGATSLAKGDWSASIWHAPGIFIDNSGGAATTPTSGLLYLSSSKNPDGSNGGFDLRFGFLADPAAFVAAKGGDGTGPNNALQDLGEDNWGTTGIYMHIQGSNTGATWNITTGDAGTKAASGGRTDVAVTRTMLDGTAVTAENNVTAGVAPLELSWKLKSVSPTQVDFQAKLGANLYTMSFDPASITGGFNPATAKAVMFVGKQEFSPNPAMNPTTMRMGVLAAGDANADGKVNLTDFSALKTNYMKTNSSTWSVGDFTQDGKVNLSDFSVLKTQYMKPVTGPTLAAGMAVQDGPAVLTLVVDPATGDVKLSGSSASICGYEIDSASGSLVPGNWNSLSAQGNANYFGGGDATSLSEASMNPQSLDGLVDIGNVFKVGGQQDLVFSYLDSTGSQVFSTVSYVAVPEPAALGVLAVASIGLITRRRRAA